MQKNAWKILFLAGVMIFENQDSSVNTVRTKPFNRITENTHKLHSFKQQTC